MCHWDETQLSLFGLQTTNTAPGNWDGKTLLEIQNMGLQDSDGDGIPDLYEDTDDDGLLGDDDTDGDGIPDYLDPDDDGDGIPTRTEVTDGETYGADIDDDGIPNYLDTDSDGDGLTDRNEGTDDTDGDGIPDYLDPSDWDPCTSYSFHYCLETGECTMQEIPMAGCPTDCLHIAIIDKQWYSSDCGGESGPREDEGDDGGTGPSQFSIYPLYIGGPDFPMDGGVYYQFYDSNGIVWEWEELLPTDETITPDDLIYDGENNWWFWICNDYDTDVQINLEITIGCQDTYTGEPMPGFTVSIMVFSMITVLVGYTLFLQKKNKEK